MLASFVYIILCMCIYLCVYITLTLCKLFIVIVNLSVSATLYFCKFVYITYLVVVYIMFLLADHPAAADGDAPWIMDRKSARKVFPLAEGGVARRRNALINLQR